MSKHKVVISILVSILSIYSSYAQDTTQDTTQHANQDDKAINYKHLALVGTIIPVTFTGVYVYLNHVWWKEQRVPFHVSDDLEMRYALNLDKAGHFVSSNFVSVIFSDILQVTGLNERQAIWAGAGLSFINATIVEIKDAYAPYWGFSKFDMLANFGGAFYPVLQHYVPYFQSISFKWSYDFSNPSYYKSMPGHENKSFIDDYERQNFWLSFDYSQLFFAKQNLPIVAQCIQPALGLSAQNIDGKGAGQHEWFIGIDINLTKLAFTKSKAEAFAYKYMNFYHLPSPAVRLKPQTKWYAITY